MTKRGKTLHQTIRLSHHQNYDPEALILLGDCVEFHRVEKLKQKIGFLMKFPDSPGNSYLNKSEWDPILTNLISPGSSICIQIISLSGFIWHSQLFLYFPFNK